MTKRLKDREVANRPYGRITWEQYLFLNPMAKELHDWWMNEKPEMYNEMADEGSLLPELKKRGYEFVTIRDLFRESGVKPRRNVVYMGVDEVRENYQ